MIMKKPKQVKQTTFLTVKEASMRTGLPVAAINKIIKGGKLPYYTPAKKWTFILAEDLNEYMLANRRYVTNSKKILEPKYTDRKISESIIKGQLSQRYQEILATKNDADTFLENVNKSIVGLIGKLGLFGERRMKIFSMRLIGNRPYDEIALEVGLCRERTRQIFESSLDSIASYVKNFMSRSRIEKEKIARLQLEVTRLNMIVKRYNLIIDHKNIADSISENPFNNSKVKFLSKKMIEFDFSVRTINCLAQNDIYTVYDLCQYSIKEVSKMRNFGKKTILEIEQQFSSKGFNWSDLNSEIAGEKFYNTPSLQN
jgi:hypothetical protein